MELALREPGTGGWGAILEYQGHERELSGGAPETTNNRMELTAVIQALRQLKEPCAVELYSDSKYVVDALEKGWVWGWKKRGWIKSDKKPALNVDLWGEFAAAPMPPGPLSLGQRPSTNPRTTDVTRWPWQSPRNKSLTGFSF